MKCRMKPNFYISKNDFRKLVLKSLQAYNSDFTKLVLKSLQAYIFSELLIPNHCLPFYLLL